MKTFLLLAILTLAITSGLYIRVKASIKTQAQVVQPFTQAKTTHVSAMIGGPFRFRLFGYSSPSALITLDGKGLYSSTYADESGYFEFKDEFSPRIATQPCLTAQDQFGRLSVPVCLAPFSTDRNEEIGPVLMPPTVSLDKTNYFIGDQIVLSGQTIPNSEINLSTFTNDQNIITRFLTYSIIRPVEAYDIPELVIKSDREGNFSVGLPSSSANIYRVFAQTDYLQNLSPKSLTLQLEVLPLWMIVIKLLGLLLQNILSRLLEVIIITEIGLMVWYFLRRYFHPAVISRNHALVLHQGFPLEKEEESLTLYEEHPLIKA